MKRKVGARLAASAGLALSVDKVMPTVREMCSREMLDESAYSAQRVPGVAEYTVPG